MDGQQNKVINTNIINILAGLWLIVFPILYGLAGTSFSRNEYFIGIVVAILALIRVFSPMRSEWASWINAVAGLWLIISPFFFAGLMAGAIWNNVLIGILVIIMALWSTMTSPQIQHPRMG